jgi:hypothetical protein
MNDAEILALEKLSQAGMGAAAPTSKVTTAEDIRMSGTESLEDYWNSSLSFGDNLRQLFEYAIAIPDKDVQLPIFLAYGSVPSTLASVIPILFLHGQEGTGKSNAAILLSGVFGSEVNSASTTFAAIRNKTRLARWTLPDSQDGERNCCIIFDNVNLQTLKNENLYSYFLNGYSRRTDAIEISKGDGSNMVFKVFSPKVLSSIHALYAHPSLSEIARRLIVLKFKRIERFTEEELNGFDVSNRLEIDTMDLSLLHREFIALWSIEKGSNKSQKKLQSSESY